MIDIEITYTCDKCGKTETRHESTIADRLTYYPIPDGWGWEIRYDEKTSKPLDSLLCKDCQSDTNGLR